MRGTADRRMMAQEERSGITEEGRPDEREIRKPDEVLELLTAKAREGSTSAMIAL